MISHLTLTTKTTLSPSVRLTADTNGFEFLAINHPKFNALFSLHGGHLVHFQPSGQPPFIWLSKSAIFDSQKAIRGGVPICWPWFGSPSPELGENLPSHGFARTSKWNVGKVIETSDNIELDLCLSSNEQTLKLWPFEFELTLKATLSEQLKLALITTNKSNKPLNYYGALHSYLNISAPDSVKISGLNGEYYDSLNNKALNKGDTTLVIDKAIDSIYKKAPLTIELIDKHFERILHISNQGNDSEVVWSPWIEGARAFSDMPDNGYQTMVCIESSITQGDGQTINPGESHSLTTIIK